MPDKDKVDGFYQRQAKDLVNMMYDKGFIAEDVSRKSMQGLEDLVAYMFQSHADSAVKCAELIKRTKKGASNESDHLSQ